MFSERSLLLATQFLSGLCFWGAKGPPFLLAGRAADRRHSETNFAAVRARHHGPVCVSGRATALHRHAGHRRWAEPVPRRFGWIEGVREAVTLPPLNAEQPRQRISGSKNGRGKSFGMSDPLARLGDGPGRKGFHKPLRSACWAYAARVLAGGERDDMAFIEAVRMEIKAAPRRPGRDVTGYQGDYLQRSIVGAFSPWLALSISTVPHRNPTPGPRRLPLNEASAALCAAVAAFFLAEREWTAIDNVATDATQDCG